MNLPKPHAGNPKMPIIVALIIGLAGGVLISNFTMLGHPLDLNKPDNKPAEKNPLYWVAPMDPNFRRDEPGKSPMGMDLIPVYTDESSGNTVQIACKFFFDSNRATHILDHRSDRSVQGQRESGQIP